MVNEGVPRLMCGISHSWIHPYVHYHPSHGRLLSWSQPPKKHGQSGTQNTPPNFMPTKTSYIYHNQENTSPKRQQQLLQRQLRRQT